MLGKQVWRPRSPRAFISPIDVHRLRSEDRCGRFSVERSLSSVRPANSDRTGLTSNLLNLSSPSQSWKATRLLSSKQKHDSTLRRFEPWIDPNSLSKSLDAHRQANRGGHARDGVPVQNPKRSRTLPKPSTKTGSQTGTKVLHLTLPKSIQEPEDHYDGICPPLLAEWRFKHSLPTRLKYPWLSMLRTQDSDDAARSAMEHLNAELRAWEAYFSPSEMERQAAVDAFADVTKVLRQISIPCTKIDLIGSRAAGTDCPTSDLDINIDMESMVAKDGSIMSPRAKLHMLYQEVFRKEFRDILLPHAYILGARVPVIIGTHVPTGLEFQIQSTTSAYDSLQVTKAFVAEYPSARILFKLIKQMLSMRGLTKGSSGGLTSYPLLNMVVTSLKMAGPHIAADDVAGQLLYFLDFWSDFRFRQHRIIITSAGHETTNRQSSGISIDPISSIPRMVLKEGKKAQGYMMSMEDPADPFNDLGISVHGIKHVQACFIMARYTINRSLSEWSILSNYEDRETRPLLAWILGGNYTSFEEARLQLRRFCEQKMQIYA